MRRRTTPNKGKGRRYGIMYPDLAAVFYDGDGTLFDSEPLIHDVWREIAAERGCDFAVFDYAAAIGKKEAEVAAMVRDAFGFDEEPEELYRRHQDRLRERLPGELKAKPGAEALLKKGRKAGLPPCLVTSAAEWHATLALKTTGFKEYFRVMVTADSPGLARFKPHPDPYLMAAKLLHLERRELHRAVAFEDSPSGARSARDAGMIVVGIPSPFVPAARFAGIAHHLIPDGQTLEDFEFEHLAHLLPC